MIAALWYIFVISIVVLVLGTYMVRSMQKRDDERNK